MQDALSPPSRSSHEVPALARIRDRRHRGHRHGSHGNSHDASVVTELGLRERLARSGYLKRTIADAISADITGDGRLQTHHLVPGDTLEPSFIRAKAGVPLAITFGAGTGHLTSVSIPVLDITGDITSEGSKIVIENPVPGTYELVCAEGYTDATLVIE